MTGNHPPLAVAELITALGSDQFHPTLVNSLRDCTGADHCLLIGYDLSTAKAATVFSDGAIEQPLAVDCHTRYDEHYYLKDPNRLWLANQNDNAVQVIRRQPLGELPDRDYRKELIERCGIREKAAYLYRHQNKALSLNLYRLESSDSRGLSTQALQQVGQVLGALLEKHITLNEQNTIVFNLSWVRSRLRAAVGEQLTEREVDVGACIVLGHSSESIALNLGISVNTVLSHRRNLYNKLGIGTQNQFFKKVVEARVAANH